MKRSTSIILSGFIALLAALAAGVFATPTHIAYAADTIDCGVTADQIAQITAIQNDPTLTYTEEVQQELVLRKQLVSQTITCAEQGVQTLQLSLQSTTVDSSSGDLQANFASKLNDASNFYTMELARLNDSGIAGTQEIAKDVLNWRQSTFVPLTDQVNNFILWTQNQSLFATAQTRMDQTSRAVEFLESASPDNDLQNAFDSTSASFNTAVSQNAAAKSALAQGLPADQTLALIKGSLDSLSATYQGFSQVSTLIKNILPQ